MAPAGNSQVGRQVALGPEPLGFQEFILRRRLSLTLKKRPGQGVASVAKVGLALAECTGSTLMSSEAGRAQWGSLGGALDTASGAFPKGGDVQVNPANSHCKWEHIGRSSHVSPLQRSTVLCHRSRLQIAQHTTSPPATMWWTSACHPLPTDRNRTSCSAARTCDHLAPHSSVRARPRPLPAPHRAVLSALTLSVPL